ncbi:MAG: PAS domain S-box protein [Paludibacter sp.]|nr:PAS domain S-box protein [Paludibacter sp.]
MDATEMQDLIVNLIKEGENDKALDLLVRLQEANSELEEKLKLRTHELEEMNVTLKESMTENKKNSSIIESIFNSVPGLIYLYDENGKLVKWNSRHEYMTGYSSKELLQRNMMDWFKDDYESQNNIDSALNTMALKGYGEAEAKLQKKNGSRIPVYFTFSALKMNDSQYFTGIGMDITRIKKAEEKIKESYTVLRIAGEKAQLGGWSADLSNNKVYWSDEVAVLHEMPVGYSPSVEDGINFYAPEWREKMTKIFNDCARNGIPYDVEMEIITASGKRVWIETIAEAVKDDAGNIIKIQGAFQNISERRKVNKSLQQERELYFDLVNNQPAGIYRIRVLPMNKWEKDAWTNSKKSPYIMELASDRFCEILGITRHDFEVNPFIIDDLVYPQDKSDFKLRNEEANAKLIPFRWEGRMLIQDKICWVHLESIPRQVENGEILWTGILYDISENKQTELALKESDERFQMLFNQAPLGYQSLDINGHFLEVNNQWLETLGYKREEVIGKWFGDFLTPMYQDGFRQRFPIFKAQGHIHSEFEMLHKNGSILFIAFEGRIGKDLKGNFKQTHCILQDITESKRANEVLIKSREDFMDLFDNAPIGYHEIDAGGRIVRMNQTELNMLGYIFGELVGKHFWSTITEENVSRKAIEAKLSGEYIPHNFFEREFRKKDGTTLSVLLKDKIFKDIDGHITGIRTTVQDITERKKAESALIESEEKFKNIFEHSAVGKSLTTIDGKLKVNYAFRKILGYSEEELYLKNWKEITYKDDIEYNEKTVKSILRGDRVSSQWEKRYIHKNGSIVWVDITTTLQRDKTGNPLFFITEITDITERKEVESALLESEKEYRNLLDMSPVAKCILHDWTLIYVNHSAIKLFGAKSSKDLVNKPILELIHPDFHILTHENAKLLAKKGYVPKQEQRFIRIDGHVLDVETQSKSIRFNGKLATLVDISDITDRKKAEYELLINSKRLNALVKILQSPADSIQNYLDLALNQAIEMTDSKLGYIYHYSETKKEFVLNSWSKEVMNECKVQEKQTVYLLEKTGLWGEVVRQRKPIVVNDFQAAHPLKKGQPGGHAPLHKYLTIPVIVDNQIVGVVGVANKETDYVDNDIKQLTVLMDIVWNALGKRQTDISLQISEEKFKKAFMTSPDSININRLEDGMYVSINNGFTRITGYTEEDILGKTSIEKNIWVDLADRDRLVQGLKEKGIVENLIAQFSTKSGGIIYGMMSASIIELNGVKHLLNITRDISDIRKTELALQKSKATLDTALASTTDAIFITDSEGNYIQFNEAFVKFTRFRNKDEVYTKFNHFTDILEVFNSNDEVAPPETWAVARALRGEIVNNFEYKLRRKDTGETWTGSYSFSPMRDDKGEIIGAVVVARDITDFKEAEIKLLESEKKLSTLFAAMTEMVAIHELELNGEGEAINYRIIDCNDAFTKHTGYSKDEAIGKLASELYGTTTAPYLEEYAKVAQSGVPYEFSTYFPPMDKHFLISVVSPSKNKFATITNDITEIQYIQEEIKLKNKELENYIYAASHDLRSPLVNIQGFSQRLKKQTEEIKMALSANGQGEIKLDNLEELTIDAIPKTLNFILSNVTKMDALINGLLQISRTGRVTMAIKKVKMNNLFKTINQHYSFEITEIDATINIDDLPDCYGDENQLNRLFSNIIGNALKYRDSNRKLEVNISAKINYNKVVYCIADNGIGIASRNIEKIWNVFYRVDSTVSEAGDGIGLSLVKRIADKHKGKVWVESEEGIGSRFYVELQKNDFEE